MRSGLVCLVTHPIWPINTLKSLIALAFRVALIMPRHPLERSIVVYVFNRIKLVDLDGEVVGLTQIRATKPQLSVLNFQTNP
jgi:hypothetical protein